MRESIEVKGSLGDRLLGHFDTPWTTDHWSIRLTNEAFARLTNRFPELHRFEVHVIVGLGRVPAFTCAGHHIFIDCRLIERLATVDAIAFVLAHELAHQLCGHVARTPTWIKRCGWGWPTILWCILDALRRRAGEHHLIEAEADTCGLEMCVAAGLDTAKCIEGVRALERYVRLDLHGCPIGDEAFYASGMNAEERSRRIRRHLWRRGYFPLPVRRKLLAYQFGLIDKLDVHLR